MPAAQELGGVAEAADVSATAVRLEPTSHTFHGRDIFSPVAAVLARGGRLDTIGEPVDPSTLTPLALPTPQASPGRLTAHVLYADAFGNLVLDARPADLAASDLEDASSLFVGSGELSTRR